MPTPRNTLPVPEVAAVFPDLNLQQFRLLGFCAFYGSYPPSSWTVTMYEGKFHLPKNRTAKERQDLEQAGYLHENVVRPADYFRIVIPLILHYPEWIPVFEEIGRYRSDERIYLWKVAKCLADGDMTGAMRLPYPEKNQAAGTGEGSVWRKAPETEKAGPMKFWSPDGGLHYGFEAAGEMLLIRAEDYARLGTERQSGRFVEGNVIELTDGPAEFTLRVTRPGMITIGSFNYPLKMDIAGRTSSGAVLGGIVDETNVRIQRFIEQVEANLFTRSIVQYRSLGAELRRFQGKIETLRPCGTPGSSPR